MSTKLKMLEAAILQTRSKALAEIVAIEVLLDNPAGVPEHTNYVDEILQHAQQLAEYEDTMRALNTYFVPAPAAALPSSPQGQGRVIQGEELAARSGTYRQSIKDQKGNDDES
jgi:hypothetical protein